MSGTKTRSLLLFPANIETLTICLSKLTTETVIVCILAFITVILNLYLF